MSASMLAAWMQGQKLKAPGMKDAPILYRNLEEALDTKRREHGLLMIRKNIWKSGVSVDFISSDTLSIGATGCLRHEFNEELGRYGNLPLGAASSRMMDGNYEYLETVEREIAEFHGAETGLIVASGFEANVDIFAAIPRAGDAIVYDELVHASTHDGMQQSQATHRIPFRHNSVDAFRDVLISVFAVESIYSMDGDVCPLRDLVEVAKEIFPSGNAQFLVDEAHSTGILGPQGAGLVSDLGLEKEVAIRLHTFGKAMGSSGAIILGNQTVKTALTNFARPIIYSTGPAFPIVAAIRSSYRLMKAGRTQEAQESVQRVVKHFFKVISADPVWEKAMRQGVVEVPLLRDWETRPFVTHIVPIWTRPQYSYWLVFHLHIRNFCASPVEYPAVPKGQSRVRLTFHANNTESQVEGLVEAIGEWASEMMEIEGDRTKRRKLPSAARQVYALMGDDKSREE
ncbi:MAG: hypothetical protein Q9172_001247 [Xanthocarpia lactea]